MLLEEYIQKLKKGKLKEFNKPWLNSKIINDNFLDSIYPNNKIEEWKNFNIKLIKPKKLKIIEDKDYLNEDKVGENYKNLIVFKNGIFEESVFEKNLNEKINIIKIRDYVKNKKNFNKEIHSDFNKYSENRISGITDNKTVNLLSLNAILNHGMVIEIPSNTLIEKPIHIYNHISSKCALINPYLFIILGENCKLELIDITCHAGVENWINIFYEIYLEKNSYLKMSNLSLNQVDNVSTASYNFHMQEKASLDFSTINKGFSKKDIRVFLDGKNSKAKISGMLLSNHKEINDVFCKVTHNSKNTNSSQDWRMISSGNSQTSLNGKIRILKDSKKSSGNFLSKSLLLDDKAKSLSKPELEIFEDDVSCTHGASFGEIEKEKIFYLQSRGLSKNEATKLLVYAFVEELKLNNNSLQKDINAEIEKIFTNRHL